MFGRHVRRGRRLAVVAAVVAATVAAGQCGSRHCRRRGQSSLGRHGPSSWSVIVVGHRFRSPRSVVADGGGGRGGGGGGNGSSDCRSGRTARGVSWMSCWSW